MRATLDAPESRPRVVLYLRKSHAGSKATRTSESRSVEDQRDVLTAKCQHAEWEIVDEFIDDGVGASEFSKGKRKGWAAMLERLAQGDVDIVAAWSASRANRQLDTFVPLRKACKQHGVKLATGDDVYDLNKSNDSYHAANDVLQAEREAASIREGILRTTKSTVDKGLPHGRIPYGYKRDHDIVTGKSTGQTKHPVEGPIVVDMITRVAAGESMYSIAGELIAAGVKTRTGADWTATSVRYVARNLTYAGVREHHGVRHDADWPALVPESLVLAARARTNGNAAQHRMPSSAAKHLLSGLALCGKCGARMYKFRNRVGTPTYACRAPQSVDADGRRRGIGHLTILLDQLDGYVTGEVDKVLLALNTDAAMNEASRADDPIVIELEALRGRLASAMARWKAGRIDDDDYAEFAADLKPKIRALETRARRVALSPVVIEAAGQRLEDMSFEEQREIIASLVSVTVMPKGAPGSKPNDRIKVVPKRHG